MAGEEDEVRPVVVEAPPNVFVSYDSKNLEDVKRVEALTKKLESDARRRYLFEVLGVLVSATLGVLTVTFGPSLGPVAARIRASSVLRLGLMLATIAAAVGLFQLRRRALAFYGGVEVVVGCVMAWSATDKLLTSDRYAAMLSLVAAVYVMIRGLTNLENWNAKKQAAEKERLEKLEAEARAKEPGYVMPLQASEMTTSQTSKMREG